MVEDRAPVPWITYASIAGCTLITLIEKMCKIPVEQYGCSYSTVANRGELWRIPIAAFSHRDMWHLALTIFVLWQCRVLETICGNFAYLRMHAVVVVLSTGLSLFVDRWAVKIFRNSSFVNSIRNRYIVGYSPVVLSCVVVLTQEWTVGERIVRDMISDGTYWSDVVERKGLSIFEALSGIPLIAVICALVLLDHTSFVAHGAGLLLGTLVWGGVFDWMTEYWFSCGSAWLLVAFAVSCAHTAHRRRRGRRRRDGEENGDVADETQVASWLSRLFRGRVEFGNESIRLFHVHFKDRETKKKIRIEIYDPALLRAGLDEEMTSRASSPAVETDRPSVSP